MANTLNERYKLIRPLGAGGQGDVSLASDITTDRQVAIKSVAKGSGTLLREFQWLSAIVHPGLAQVYAVGVAQSAVGDIRVGDLFFVSEYIAGLSVADNLATQPVQNTGYYLEEQLLDICQDIGSALSHLHQRGLAHGDVKPDNMRYRESGDTSHNQAVLLDLGLASGLGTGVARGTLAYMAPEALAGHIDQRSDLYGLGVSLIEFACGQPLYLPTNRQDLIAQILSSPDKIAEKRVAHLATPVAKLLVQLVSKSPTDRPSGVDALLGHVVRIRESLGLPAKAVARTPNFSRSELQGNRASTDEIASRFRKFTDGQSNASFSVVGAIGSGRTRAVEEALLVHQLHCAKQGQKPLRVLRIDDDKLGADPETTYDNCRLAGEKTLIWVRDDGIGRGLRYLTLQPSAEMLILVCHESDASTPGLRIHVPLLEEAASAALAQSMAALPLTSTWQKKLFALTSGNPGQIINIMRLAAVIDPEFTSAPDVLAVDLRTTLSDRIESLCTAHREIIDYLAILRKPISIALLAQLQSSTIDATSCNLQALCETGLVRMQNAEVRLSMHPHAPLIDEQIPAKIRKKLHQRVLEFTQPEDASEQFRHLQIVGTKNQIRDAANDAIAEAQSCGRNDDALALALAAEPVFDKRSHAHHCLLIAELALFTGDYELAQRYAKAASPKRDQSLATSRTLLLARCAAHLGKLDESRELLTGLLTVDPDNEEAVSHSAATFLKLGRFDEATEQAGLGKTSTDILIAARAREVSGLVALYRGEFESAHGEFREIERIAESSKNTRVLGRACGLLGMVSQQQGRLAEAGQFYRQAAEHSSACGARHAEAVFRLNGATVEQRSAHYAAALDSYKYARRALEASGTPAALAAAHWNRGNTLLCLGELVAAESEADTAAHLASEASDGRMVFFSQLLHGDLSARRERFGQADLQFTDAMATAEKYQLVDGYLAEIHRAECACLAGRQSKGLPACILAHRESGAQSGDIKSAEFLACEVRIRLQSGDIDRALCERLDKMLAMLSESDDLDIGWRIAVLLSRSLSQIGDTLRLKPSIESAQKLLAEVERRSPEAYRLGLSSHPDARSLQGLVQDHLQTQARVGNSDENALPLRRLLALSRRLNSELRVDVLLDEIIDTAVELGRAERGFLLLRDSRGELKIRVARNIDQSDLNEKEELSRSIAEKVARSGQVLMTIDAEEDARFDSSQSIAALHLRSILAVPFRVRSRVVGTLYLDHRFRRGAFDEDAVSLVCELADVAAVAIENARLSGENRDRERQIDALNRQLADKLEATEAELLVVQAKLPTKRPAQGFEEIIGESETMGTLLALAKRASDCDLPVVISGESGTGKELLARAIHHNSARKDQAFVAINCGAVPESLLESELFGHVRGAFTGADRNRPGLFQVANGGTLFLDEIADTSHAMQSKLLRVLQEGEIRPLGAETIVKIDIRVLCASNTRLPALVEQGAFRQDLFYRLNVLNLDLPPLRNRREDIGAIARNILMRSAKDGAQVSLSTSALRALMAHHWPGNIRELENELMRACAIADEESIMACHLSPEITNSKSDIALPLSSTTESLLLKPQVEELEQGLLREAMRRCSGNQSKAAILLGLSRYGLQKKLQRYGISRDAS